MVIIYLLLKLKICNLNIIDWLMMFLFNSITPKKLENNITNYLKCHKVYISTTTNPERIKILTITLPQIITDYVDEVHVNIPLKYKNKEDYDDKDIDELSKIPKVKIFRVDKDLGPVTKILPTLKRIDDKDSIIISIDDDILYAKNHINRLIKMSVLYPNDVIGCGYRFSENKTTKSIKCFDMDRIHEWWPTIPANEPYIDIVEGYAGIAYKKRFIDCELLEKLNELSVDCKFSDDLTINYVLAKHNVKRRKIYSNLLNVFFIGIYPLSHGESKGISKHKTPSGYKSYNLYKVVKCLNKIQDKLI